MRKVTYVYTIAIHIKFTFFCSNPDMNTIQLYPCNGIFFPWAEWDCCVQVALYLVSALHKLQLVLISERHHFREENDLRK